MGEIIVQRDDRNRILGLSGQGIGEDNLADAAALRFLRAAIATMTDYLHVTPNYSLDETVQLVIDRTDQHLNREIDAIMEALVTGLKALGVEYSEDFVVHEATVEIQV